MATVAVAVIERRATGAARDRIRPETFDSGPRVEDGRAELLVRRLHTRGGAGAYVGRRLLGYDAYEGRACSVHIRGLWHLHVLPLYRPSESLDRVCIRRCLRVIDSRGTY